MSEVSRIVSQLHHAYHGPAWHGPALAPILADVSAETAGRRLHPEVHTIWEITLHITTWMEICTRRLQGEEIPTLPASRDWPAPTGAWPEAVQSLADTQQQLEDEVGGLTDERLKEIVLGEMPYTIYAMLHGVVQHNLYHAGQIALLKKAVS